MKTPNGTTAIVTEGNNTRFVTVKNLNCANIGNGFTVPCEGYEVATFQVVSRSTTVLSTGVLSAVVSNEADGGITETHPAGATRSSAGITGVFMLPYPYIGVEVTTAQASVSVDVYLTMRKVGLGTAGPQGATGPTGATGAAGTDAPGVIVAYGAASAPTGWLLCDGTAVNRVTYAALFAIVSTTFGVGDGSTTFNLPDLRGRFPLGKAAAGTGSTLGGTGGAIDHTHTYSGTTDGESADTGTSLSFGVDTQPTAPHTHTYSGTTGTNNPPFQAVNFIIKT